MAAWMVTASFALLVIIVLLLLSCLVILIIKLFDMGTGGTGTTNFQSIFNKPAVIAATPNSNINLLSLGPNHGAFYGLGGDGTQAFVNRESLVMQKDAFYENLTLDNTTLHTNGYRLFVAGTLSLVNRSVIQNRGHHGADNTPATTTTNARSKTSTLSPLLLVAGGLGAAVGTLGGGGDGGHGYLKDGTKADINGKGSANVFWEHDTSLFAGADATSSSSVANYGVGLAGKVTSPCSTRTMFDAVAALNASFVPTLPLLSGGSGGGGGQGSGKQAGSGGGGGGGVVVVVAKSIVVGPNGGTIDVSGGNGGAVKGDDATSGGGGGGGLILLASPASPESYAGLEFRVGGGVSVSSDGLPVRAHPGRVVNWFHPNHPSDALGASGGGGGGGSAQAKQQYLMTSTHETQVVTPPNPVPFADISHSLGIKPDMDHGAFTVQQSGLYMINCNMSVQNSVSSQMHKSNQAVRSVNDVSTNSSWVTAYVVKNSDPAYAVIGAKAPLHHLNGTNLTVSVTVPLMTNDSFEIRVARNNDPLKPVTITNGAILSAVLLTPTV